MNPVRYPTAEDWIASLPLAMTSAFEHASAFPQGNYLRVVGIILPPKTEGAGNAVCLTRTRSLACKSKKHASKSPQVRRNIPALPARMVLTVSFVLSPVIGLCCHRYLRNRFRKCDASVEASGPHDFAVREPAHSSHAPFASTASRANVRDDRETPLCSEARDARRSAGDLPDVTSGMICDTLARRANQSSACQ
jgi:hypothetical protein